MRKDKKGKKCTGTNSIMDHPIPNVYDKWSTCSYEDFEDAYNEEMAKNGKFCLEELNSKPRLKRSTKKSKVKKDSGNKKKPTPKPKPPKDECPLLIIP